MDERAKITFLITDLDFGGAEQVLYELCRGLAPKFQIQVLTLKRKGHFAKLIEELGVPVKSYGLGQKINPAYVLRLLPVFLSISSDLRKCKPDLVQGILFQGNLMAKLTGKISGSKTILCAIHTFDRARLKAVAEMLTSSLARKYIVVSGALKIFCVKNYSIPADKISVIKNGIPLPDNVPAQSNLREKLGIKPGARNIGAIARLHREKGIDLLVRAFHSLAGEFPDLDLVIIGDGPEKSKLEQMSKNLGISNRVRFAGFLPEPEQYLSLFNLFALPSRIEAMPVALMQAMAAGKAIVAAKVGGVPELMEDGKEGLLVPAEDESALSRAISRLLREPALAMALGAKAKERAGREFGLEQMLESYLALYQELTKERS